MSQAAALTAPKFCLPLPASLYDSLGPKRALRGRLSDQTVYLRIKLQLAIRGVESSPAPVPDQAGSGL